MWSIYCVIIVITIIVIVIIISMVMSLFDLVRRTVHNGGISANKIIQQYIFSSRLA